MKVASHAAPIGSQFRMPTRLLCYFMTQHCSQQRYNFPTSPTSGSRYWRPPGHRGTENWKTPRVSHFPTPRRRLGTMSERGVTLTLHLVQKIGQVMIAPEVTVVGEFAMTQFFVEPDQREHSQRPVIVLLGSARAHYGKIRLHCQQCER
jgi:hypothetical protein